MKQEKNIKAKLTIVLKADEKIIAYSNDQILWQNVLVAINASSESSTDENLRQSNLTKKNLLFIKGPESELAKEIGVSVEILQGACSPSKDMPYIQLDKHSWEAMKKSTPSRGPSSISPIVLAATLLILWKEKAALGDSTISDSQKVLDTIGLYDKHPYRSIANCEWLQLRNKVIVINPAQTSKAIDIAKAYCTKEWQK